MARQTTSDERYIQSLIQCCRDAIAEATTAASLACQAAVAISIDDAILHASEAALSSFDDTAYAESYCFNEALRDLKTLADLTASKDRDLEQFLNSRLWGVQSSGYTKLARKITALWRQTHPDFPELVEWLDCNLFDCNQFATYEAHWALLGDEFWKGDGARLLRQISIIKQGQATGKLRLARAIFLGDGDAGKTSIVDALLDRPVDTSPTQAPNTHAGDLNEEGPLLAELRERDEETDAGDSVRVHFWDFAGQSQVHQIHKFFLSPRSIFIIVVDSRKSSNPTGDIRYWLTQIRTFAQHASVIVVANKSDVQFVYPDIKLLEEETGIAIVGFYQVSAILAGTSPSIESRYLDESRDGAEIANARLRVFRSKFAAFKDTLREQLLLRASAAPITKAQEQAINVAQAALALKDYLHEREFSDLCATPMSPDALRDIKSIIHDFGLGFSFSAPALRDKIINPRWLTFGVYTVLFMPSETPGIVSLPVAASALNMVEPKAAKIAVGFDDTNIEILWSSLELFEVAYLAGDRSAALLYIPSRFDERRPDGSPVTRSGSLCTAFEFQHFAPHELLTRLVLRRRNMIYAGSDQQKILWRFGVALSRGSAHALIELEPSARRLSIYASQPEDTSNIANEDAELLALLHRDVVELAEDPGIPPYVEYRRLPFAARLNKPRTDDERARMRAAGQLDDWITGEAYRSLQTYYSANKQKKQRRIVPGLRGGLFDMSDTVTVRKFGPDVQPREVFLSYARAMTDATLVSEVNKALTAKGLFVFYDTMIPAQKKWDEVLKFQLLNSSCVVVFWSDEALVSEYTLFEAECAGAERRINVICAGFDPGKCPYADEQAIIASGDNWISQLAQAVAMCCERSSTS